MAVFTNSEVRLLADTLDIAGFASSAAIDASIDEHDVSVIGGAGWRRKIPGLASHTLNVEGFQDFAVGGVDETFPGTGTGVTVFTFCPINFGDTVSDPCFLSSGFTTTRNPLSGTVGDPAAFTLNWAGTERTVRAQVLHPVGAEVATGSGTAATFTTPVAGQSIWATFHVLAKSGTAAPTITFTIQTDSGVGFATPTTQITSSPFTAVGAQYAQSAVGALAGETHIRVAWTISGTNPSFTFLVAAGVN